MYITYAHISVYIHKNIPTCIYAYTLCTYINDYIILIKSVKKFPVYQNITSSYLSG